MSETENKKQMVWHAYHAETLCQFVDLEARWAQIVETKPDHELPTRLRLMKPVGELPREFVAACEKESVTRKAAWEAQTVRNPAWEAREARNVAYTAQRASYIKHKAEIERLHAIECPDCPWDGKTIFPE